jgi:hypothetical protein
MTQIREVHVLGAFSSQNGGVALYDLPSRFGGG